MKIGKLQVAVTSKVHRWNSVNLFKIHLVFSPNPITFVLYLKCNVYRIYLVFQKYSQMCIIYA